MAVAVIDRLWNWKLRLGESWAGWVDFEPFSELDDVSCPEVRLSKDGYAVAAGHQDSTVSLASSEDLSLPARGDIVISVDVSLCYRRVVEVPVAARGTVEKILALDLASFMPMARDDLLTGHHVLGQGNSPGTLKVAQIVVRKEFLRPLLDYCNNRGTGIKAVTFHDAVKGRLPVALGLDGTPFATRQFRRWAQLSIASYAGLLGAALIVASAVAWHASEVSARIASETASLQERVAAVQDRLEKLKSSSAEAASLVEWKLNSTLIPVVIDDLSHLLPDSAFVEELTIDGAMIQIQGQAVAPERLIAELEASPHFKDVSFISPVFRNPSDLYSRFSLRMSVESPLALKAQ